LNTAAIQDAEPSAAATLLRPQVHSGDFTTMQILRTTAEELITVTLQTT